jgi:hypothetical protein
MKNKIIFNSYYPHSANLFWNSTSHCQQPPPWPQIQHLLLHLCPLTPVTHPHLHLPIPMTHPQGYSIAPFYLVHHILLHGTSPRLMSQATLELAHKFMGGLSSLVQKAWHGSSGHSTWTSTQTTLKTSPFSTTLRMSSMSMALPVTLTLYDVEVYPGSTSCLPHKSLMAHF